MVSVFCVSLLPAKCAGKGIRYRRAGEMALWIKNLFRGPEGQSSDPENPVEAGCICNSSPAVR